MDDNMESQGDDETLENLDDLKRGIKRDPHGNIIETE